MSGNSAGSICWPLYCGSLHHVNMSLLNTLWIIHPSGSLSWNTPWPIVFRILKGPYRFWFSFFESLFKWIFLASNHMLSPSFSPYRFHLFLSNCLFIISFAMSIVLVASSQLFCKLIKNSSSFGNSVCTVKSPFYGCCPKLSLNGVCPIAMCLLSLYWNSATASHSI